MNSFFEKNFVTPSLILGITLLLGLSGIGYGIASRNSDNTISVTGSASVQTKADQVTWRIDVRRTTYAGGINTAYTQVAKDTNTIIEYFKNQNLASSTISASVITTDENYKSDQNTPTTYNVRGTVTIETGDVYTIEKLSRELTNLTSKIDPTTLISPQAPEYRISTLPALRVSLIGKAIEDAKARATEIAKSGGSSVGALRSASSGVVQVVAPNSTNVDDYGSYDTSTIQKQVMVTARAIFYVK